MQGSMGNFRKAKVGFFEGQEKWALTFDEFFGEGIERRTV